MNDPIGSDFAAYAGEKLGPAVAVVKTRRRSALTTALLASVIISGVLAAVVYFALSPYREMMAQYGLSSWPFLLAPLSLGALAFGMVYLVLLRRAIGDFRDSLADCVADFIHPALKRRRSRSRPPQADGVLLSCLGGAAKTGRDLFCGDIAGAGVAFSTFSLFPAAGGGRKKTMLSGLYFHAEPCLRFEAPLLIIPAGSGVSRDVVEAKLRESGAGFPEGPVWVDGADGRWVLTAPSGEAEACRLAASLPAGLSLCRVGSVLELVHVSAEVSSRAEFFDNFDMDRCLAFCRSARLCLDVLGGNIPSASR